MIKAQSAIEYLMTYGWMLLVVAIAGGAIFSIVGDQSIESVQGFNSNEIQINEFGMTSNSLQMNAKTLGPNRVSLKEAYIHDENRGTSVSIDSSMSIGDNTILNLPYFQNSDSSNEIEIELTYDAGSFENLTTSGTLTVTAEFDQLALDESLIGYFNLNEYNTNKTHLLDLTNGKNHGQITGEIRQDSSFHFNGADNFILISEEGSDWVQNHKTRAATLWVYPESPTGTQILAGGVFEDNEGSYNANIGLYNGHIASRYNTLDGTTRFETEDSLSANQWHRIDYVRTGTERGMEDTEIYLDGQKQNLRESDFSRLSNWVMIGAREYGSGPEYHFDGQISNVRLYNRTLSESEIRSSHNKLGVIK